MSLNVIIVGGGIAGLAAAVGLRRAGHHVKIFERSTMSNEAGAAITVSPNASRVLLKWGLDPRAERFVTGTKSVIASGESLAVMREVDFRVVLAMTGAPVWFAHRVDLHAALRRMATTEELGEGMPKAELVLGAKVVDYSASAGSITLADGTTHTADMVVAADGVHSEAIPSVLSNNVPAENTGKSCFRFILSREEIMEDPETRKLLEAAEGAFQMFVDKSGRRLVWYPCRDGMVQSFALIVPKGDLTTSEDWNVTVKPEALMEQVEKFDNGLQALCRKAKDIRCWSLLFRRPLPAYHSDRLILIGDAAHPMLPMQAQAGAQAVEDGAALGRLFTDFADGASAAAVSARLDVFEEIRRLRASAIQMFSNYGMDEPERLREVAAQYLDVSTLPQDPKELQKFTQMYSQNYDVYAVCEQKLAALPAAAAHKDDGKTANGAAPAQREVLVA